MKAKSFDEFINEERINEAETITTKNGVKYDVITVKNKYSDRQNPTFHLIVKDKKNKTIKGWRDFFWYTEGWSQGTGRSVRGYYLNMKFYGGVGNGSGIPRPSKPYLDSYMLSSIEELLNGKYYSKEKQKEFDESVYTFDWGSKTSDFNNQMD